LAGATRKPKTTIEAVDLLKDVEVIGILGKRLGALTTIRGEWHHVSRKSGAEVFLVSHIDGKALPRSVEFEGREVVAYWDKGGAATTGGVDWDWKASPLGNQPPPLVWQRDKDGYSLGRPVTEGEEWELRGAECGRLRALPGHDFAEEMGRPFLQTGPAGYVPVFLILAARKLSPDKPPQRDANWQKWLPAPDEIEEPLFDDDAP
jgi:hypothetical protein